MGHVKRQYPGANNLKKPLPQNFTLSYDVIVPENFTWGTKGLVLLLAKEKTLGVADSYIRLKLRPGSGARDGEVTLETPFPSGYANGTRYYIAKEFSNIEKLNPLQIPIKKNGEEMQLLLDNKMLAEYVKAMPADLLFNDLSFEMTAVMAKMINTISAISKSPEINGKIFHFNTDFWKPFKD